jgi:predicted TIM-barrel fold metal-dependent hydrolase
MERRTFLSAAALAAATSPVLAPTPAAAASPTAAGLIDTNVYLSHWPMRHSWAATPALLVERLRRHGVSSAWVGSFDGVLHTDIEGANARLAATCAREPGGVLRAFGTINPTFPDWEEDLRRCQEVHRMAGVRLFPNYHGYLLDDRRFVSLIELAARRGLLVQIALTIEDDRSQSPVLTAAPVQSAPLADLVPKIPGARVMLLNGGSRVFGTGQPLLQRLTAAGVWFEIATLEGVAGIESLLQRAPGIRLAFGSHAPYFYFEAALLKLQESVLSSEQLTAVCFGNAAAALQVGRASVRSPIEKVSPKAG